MAQVSVSRSINAPAAKVFSTVADINNFRKVVKDIVKVEFLTEQQSGVGTKFRETRVMRGKEAATELEVTEYVENERIRLVSDSGGTIWDTVFTTTAHGGNTLLDMVMEARPYKMTAKLMTPMIMSMISKAIERDMDAVKAYCEG